MQNIRQKPKKKSLRQIAARYAKIGNNKELRIIFKAVNHKKTLFMQRQLDYIMHKMLEEQTLSSS